MSRDSDELNKHNPSEVYWYRPLSRPVTAGVAVTVQKALTRPVVYDRCQVLSQAVGALPWEASIANRTDLRRAATSTRWRRVLRTCTTPSSNWPHSRAEAGAAGWVNSGEGRRQTQRDCTW